MFGVRVCENTPEGDQQARLKNPVMLIPGALQALLALDKSTKTADLSHVTRKLVHLRASQINGCSVCIDMHARELKKAGEKGRARLHRVRLAGNTLLHRRRARRAGADRGGNPVG